MWWKLFRLKIKCCWLLNTMLQEGRRLVLTKLPGSAHKETVTHPNYGPSFIKEYSTRLSLWELLCTQQGRNEVLPLRQQTRNLVILRMAGKGIKFKAIV